MTVQKDLTKNIYVGNGSTKIFPFTFECPSEHPEYIKVYLTQDDGTAQATSDYLLDMSTRQITYPSSGAALPEGKKLVIMRELPLQQQMNLVNNGPYFAEDIETAFDECVMMLQQQGERLDRSLMFNAEISKEQFDNEIPYAAGKSFKISDDGKRFELTEDPAKVIPEVERQILELKNYTQEKSEEIQQLVESLNSLTREELIKLRDECKKYMQAAENAALVNTRWPVNDARVRGAGKYNYGITGGDLVLQVPTVVKIDVQE